VSFLIFPFFSFKSARIPPSIPLVLYGAIARESVGKLFLGGAVPALAQDMGLTVKEERFSRDELYLADEAFLTGTAAEVTPVREVDGRIIGPARPGPLTQKIQEIYFAVVKGQEPRYQQWLTYI
jgi:hypothetical protein